MPSLPSPRSALRRRLAAPQDQGFTLAEMLVALAIISGSLLALLSGFITSSASLQHQQERSRAARVALDLHERMRLLDYGSLDAAAGTQTMTASGGLQVEVTTDVVERSSTDVEAVAGRMVKELVTTARWTGRGGVDRSVVFTTAVAQDAKSVAGTGGYQKSIKSMSISPDPSASVDFNGYTQAPIVITLVLTGHDVTDKVYIKWNDHAASGRTTAEPAKSTDGRIWRSTIPAGPSGIRLNLGVGERHDLTFRARTSAGLETSSSLAVWGPVENPPVIASFAVTPNPIKLFNNGKNRWQNRDDVTATCKVDRLDTSSASKDSVKLNYHGEDGVLEQVLPLASVAGSVGTYSHTFARSTTYFGIGNDLPWTCVVTRFADGGPASKVINVTASR